MMHDDSGAAQVRYGSSGNNGTEKTSNEWASQLLARLIAMTSQIDNPLIKVDENVRFFHFSSSIDHLDWMPGVFYMK